MAEVVVQLARTVVAIKWVISWRRNPYQKSDKVTKFEVLFSGQREKMKKEGSVLMSDWMSEWKSLRGNVCFVMKMVQKLLGCWEKDRSSNWSKNACDIGKKNHNITKMILQNVFSSLMSGYPSCDILSFVWVHPPLLCYLNYSSKKNNTIGLSVGSLLLVTGNMRDKSLEVGRVIGIVLHETENLNIYPTQGR